MQRRVSSRHEALLDVLHSDEDSPYSEAQLALCGPATEQYAPSITWTETQYLHTLTSWAGFCSYANRIHPERRLLWHSIFVDELTTVSSLGTAANGLMDQLCRMVNSGRTCDTAEFHARRRQHVKALLTKNVLTA